MIIGIKGESFEEKKKSHIKECEEDKVGWQNELEYAIRENDLKYQQYCRGMITIMNNTLEHLKKFV